MSDVERLVFLHQHNGLRYFSATKINAFFCMHMYGVRLQMFYLFGETNRTYKIDDGWEMR